MFKIDGVRLLRKYFFLTFYFEKILEQEIWIFTCLITSDAIFNPSIKLALARLFFTIKLLFEKEYFCSKIIVEIMIRIITVYS